MAKIIHSSSTDVVDSIFTTAKENGIMHIQSQENSFDGTFFRIRDKDLINFGTCGYLGLETHPKLIEGAINLTKRYGTQLSMSRAYVKPTYIQELEDLLSQIFNGNNVICYTSTSTAHLSVVGTIFKPGDLIILDQQVHYSVQYPCMHMKLYGLEVQMVRHSNYEKLEEMIIDSYNKYSRIWYMSDGVYSMYGDLPDTDKLQTLMQKYPKLHLYFDDAHGVSWSGKNGAGTVFDKMGVNERIVLISTLAKGFGCVGGIAIFSDPEMYRKVDIYGGILSYTHPLTPGNAGAAIASAKIHLSQEIYQYQSELKSLMDHMNDILAHKNLTNISSPLSPIYFIGGGNTKVTLNLVKRILNEGIYVNTSTFPVVPNDKTGLRFTLTRHNNKRDIEKLADALEYHLPLAVKEEGEVLEKLYKKFNIPYLDTSTTNDELDSSELKVFEYNTINDIDPTLWDNALKHRSNITHSGMKCMEEVFSKNEKPEENWSFHYIIIKDKNDNLICCTFFTGALMKDDMLALESVSLKIEEVRKKDPYYLCSKTLMMSSMFTEGDPFYLDLNHKDYKIAIKKLLAYVDKTKKEIEASTVIFRDFTDDSPMGKIFEDEGFAKMRMPNTNIIRHPKWNTYDEFLENIKSGNSRNHIRRYVFKLEDLFDITIKNDLTEEEQKQYHQLFLNIKRSNYNFNFFEYPSKATGILAKYPEWEFIDIRLKDKTENPNPIASFWCFIGENHYCALIMGLDYGYLKSHQIYKQTIFQAVKRANFLNKETLYIGFSSDYEKQKYGAVSIPTYAYVKVDDTFNLELISSYSNL